MRNSTRKLLWASLPVLFTALFTAAALAQSAGRESTAEAEPVEGSRF